MSGDLSELQQLQRGRRQGCVLFPDWFSISSEENVKCIRDLEVLQIDGQNPNINRYADNTSLIAD